MAFLAFDDKPSITLHAGGGQTVGVHHGVRRMIFVTAAGPFAGACLGLVVLLVARYAPPDPLAQTLIADALFATFGLSLLNLLPLGSFDGAAILNGIVASVLRRPPGAIGWVIGAVSVVVLVSGALWLRMPEVAFIVTLVVLFMVIETRSLVDPFGRPEQVRSPASLLAHGRAAEALELAEAELAAHPDNVENALVVARALSSLTRWSDAELIYDAVLAAEPGNAPALAGRSVVRRALGRRADADADLAELVSTPPPDVQTAGAQFSGLYGAHEYARALDLVRAQRARGGMATGEAHHLLALEAVILAVVGEAEAALRHADALSAVRPDDFAIHELAALALIQLGRFEAAEARMRRALAGAPDHPELLETLGVIERLAGDPQRAFKHLLASATARPELPRARAELAACFTQLGRDAEAAAALESLPPWAADDPFVLYARACALAADGRHDEARETLAAAARIRGSLARVALVDPLLRQLDTRALELAVQPAPAPNIG